jgi:TetR/AcrR family transcriptional regulator, ethionamide resistance regulator
VTSVPSRQLASTLFWGTERVLYIAGLGVDPNLGAEESLVDPLVTLWQGALYR